MSKGQIALGVCCLFAAAFMAVGIYTTGAWVRAGMAAIPLTPEVHGPPPTESEVVALEERLASLEDYLAKKRN